METNFAVKGNNNEVIGWIMEDQCEGFGYCCCGDEHEEWGFRSAEKAEDALFEYFYQDCGFEETAEENHVEGNEIMKINVEKRMMADFMECVKPQKTISLLDKGEHYEVTFTDEGDYVWALLVNA